MNERNKMTKGTKPGRYYAISTDDNVELGMMNDTSTPNTSTYNDTSTCNERGNMSNIYNVLSNKYVIYIGLVILIICGLLLLMLPFSLHFIPYNKYALIKNRLGVVHSSPVLTQGTYYLFPLYSIVTFPSVFIRDHFESTVFSDTGLVFDLQIEYEYAIPQNKVYDIYNEFSMNYDIIIKTNSRKTIKNAASIFSVSDFLQNRTYIEKYIAQSVSTSLFEYVGVNAPTEYFRITGIDFPSNILNNSLVSALAIQKMELQENQQQVNIIIADTNQMVSKINAEATKILLNSYSVANSTVSKSQYVADNLVESARSNGIKKIVDHLQISNELVGEFVNVMAMMDNQNKTIFKDVSPGFVLNNN